MVGKMMGCFSASKVEKERAASAPRSGTLRSVMASKDSLTLLSNKPVELPDPGKIISLRSVVSFENEHWNGAKAPSGARLSRVSDEGAPCPKSRTEFLKRAEEGRKAFSGPLVGSAAHNVTMGRTSPRLLPNYESSHEAASRSNSCGLNTLRRTTSFGGQPQPLPPPALAPAKATPEDVGRSSQQVRSLKLEEGPSSWAARRGRVAPVGGLPLPPPSLAGKLLTSVTAFEFADLVGDSCVAGRAIGDVYRSRVQDLSGKMDVTVFRLPENLTHAL